MKCNAESRPYYFFCERVRTSCCILLTIFKTPTILTEIVDFLKIVKK